METSHLEAPPIQAEGGNMGPDPSALPMPGDQTMGTLTSARSRLQAGMGTGHNENKQEAGMGTGHESTIDEARFTTTQQTDHSPSLSEQTSQSRKTSHVSLHLALENNSTSGPPPFSAPPPFSTISSSQSQHEQ